jgi:hypothetical protein
MMRLVTLVGLLALLLVAAGLASAQSGYDLSWWTVDGGGGTVAEEGGGYSLSGTAGQPDAGPALSGGGYTLVGGFWSGAQGGSGGRYRVYLPSVMRNW